MSGIGATKAWHIMSLERRIEGGKIVLGNHAIAVEKYKIFARSTLYAIIACYASTFVLLEIIARRQPVGILLHYVATRVGAAVLHYYYLKIFHSLCRQACQQIAHLVATVIHRHYH